MCPSLQVQDKLTSLMSLNLTYAHAQEELDLERSSLVIVGGSEHEPSILRR